MIPLTSLVLRTKAYANAQSGLHKQFQHKQYLEATYTDNVRTLIPA